MQRKEVKQSTVETMRQKYFSIKSINWTSPLHLLISANTQVSCAARQPIRRSVFFSFSLVSHWFYFNSQLSIRLYFDGSWKCFWKGMQNVVVDVLCTNTYDAGSVFARIGSIVFYPTISRSTVAHPITITSYSYLQIAQIRTMLYAKFIQQIGVPKYGQ